MDVLPMFDDLKSNDGKDCGTCFDSFFLTPNGIKHLI